MSEPARQDHCADDSDPAALRAAISAAVDYRGDVTITLRSADEPAVGFVFDRTDSVLRLLPADGAERVTIPLREVVAIRFTGRDAAEGRSFEAWVRRYVQKKLAGESANTEAPDEEEA